MISTSVVEKHGLSMRNSETVGLWCCKSMHVLVPFKVHSDCLKTIKIKTRYLFMNTFNWKLAATP